jgi:hypothetical protein
LWRKISRCKELVKFVCAPVLLPVLAQLRLLLMPSVVVVLVVLVVVVHRWQSHAVVDY